MIVHMNGKGKRAIQGGFSDSGLRFFLGLALVSILIPLPFFVLAIALYVLTIVHFRASPLAEARAAVPFLRLPCLRSPPA